MRPSKVATDRADMRAAERHRRTHPQHALRFDAAMRQSRLGFVDLSQDTLGSFVELLTLFSQRQVAGAAGNEARLGPPSSVARRLLTTLSARPISRPAADRLPAPTMRTNVRSSGDVVQHARLSYFPIGGEYLQSAEDNIPHREGLGCRHQKGATNDQPCRQSFHLSRRETLRTVGAAAALATGAAPPAGPVRLKLQRQPPIHPTAMQPASGRTALGWR